MMLRDTLPAAAAVAAVLTLPAVLHADFVSGVGGFGAVGDSLFDEYRFYEMDPADRTGARSVVEVLAELRGLDFGGFTMEDRGSPRLEGYANNWARSRATAASSFDVGPGADFRPFFELGQVEGVTSQIASGDVDTTLLFIGSNDFLQFFIAPPADPQAELQTLVPRMVYRVADASGAILAADEDSRLVLTTLPDITRMPAARASVELAVASGLVTREEAEGLLGGVGQAIAGYNEGLREVASGMEAVQPGRQVAVVDFAGLIDEVFAPEEFVFDGVVVNRFEPGVGLEHLFAPDGIHPNTPLNGLIANLYLETLNEEFGADYALLSEAEIAAYARSVLEGGGGGDGSATPTGVPSPTAAAGGLVLLGLVLMRRGGGRVRV